MGMRRNFTIFGYPSHTGWILTRNERENLVANGGYFVSGVNRGVDMGREC